MKKLFTLLVFVFSFLLTRAGNNDGAISITSLGTQAVRIEVDNKNYGASEHSITIHNLAPGYHTIKIVLQTDMNNRAYASYNYKKQLLYSASIRVKPQYHVDIVINRFGKALVDERFMDATYMNEFCKNDDYYEGQVGYNNNYNKNYNNRPNDYNRPYNDSRYKDASSYKPMSDQSFTALWETMRKENFESTRLELMRQQVEINFFTTMQVKQLLSLFSFEDSKLDIAKNAYRNTVDKENYFQLYDVFTFSKSKEDLSAYIRNVR